MCSEMLNGLEDTFSSLENSSKGMADQVITTLFWIIAAVLTARLTGEAHCEQKCCTKILLLSKAVHHAPYNYGM
jgi:hypothetical protein